MKNKEIKAVYDSFSKNGIEITEITEDFEDSVLPSVKHKESKKKLIEKMKENWIEKIQKHFCR